MLYLVSHVDGVSRSLVHMALQLSRCSHYSQFYRASARIRAQACRNVLYIRVAQNNWRARPKPSRISGICKHCDSSHSAKADSQSPRSREAFELLILARWTRANDTFGPEAPAVLATSSRPEIR